ncbi:hypothetical protein SAMN04489761_2410 [Tenacibaculum sp. MAR_2009_124]|uniref:hypothetical protein n=1 Tax=Tenacibaculum sp. MAR_2009_124 TaxID=1250059 RepID=UPI00089BFBBF|nr:hypothetical protein [Tenacibaculum sp. MAR_2009_124]SEC22057.1 hypothetical protein SAMN04489761_2410 [Tenacibaculum sp. MAR_2009_124]
MKKLQNLQGFKILSKEEKKEISGQRRGWKIYCGGPGECCVRYDDGSGYCDAGYCMGNRCIWA